jgi:LytS/YehU family sensor histidine kinase
LEFLNAYLAIMEARFGDRLHVEVDASPESRRALIPHLILQPLVENAVKHSTAEASKSGEVLVRVACEGDRLSLVVQDNGPGLKGEPEEATAGGVGLSNTRERLATLYGESHGMELSNGPWGGLRVEITLPRREAGTR